MYISDIQEEKDGKFRISFSDELTNEDCMDIIISKSSIKEVSNFYTKLLINKKS